MKSICGFGGEQKQINSDFDNLLFRGNSVNRADVTNVINRFLSTMTDEFAAPKIDDGISQKSTCVNCPVTYSVTELEVYHVLSRLDIGKASMNDCINNKLLRTLADVLAAPICSLINNTLEQGVVPDQWKMARVTPIPKSKPMRNIENDIRPISVTCPISRIAEHFVAKFFDDHFDDLLDDNQFGTTKGRSTT